MNRLQAIFANKHTTGAAVVYIGVKILAQIGAVWFPEHKAQFDSTFSIVESAALTYGLVLAGDAKPVNGDKHEENSNSPTDAAKPSA